MKTCTKYNKRYTDFEYTDSHSMLNEEIIVNKTKLENLLSTFYLKSTTFTEEEIKKKVNYIIDSIRDK